MIMNDNSNHPDVIIAQLKQQGRKNKEIAALVYPELPIESAVVKVSRHVKKGAVAQYLKQSKQQAIQDLGLNWKDLLQTFKDANQATKINQLTGEIEPDHTARMSAAKELIKHMPPAEETSTNSLEGLEGIDLTNMDTVELKHAVFKRTNQ